MTVPAAMHMLGRMAAGDTQWPRQADLAEQTSELPDLKQVARVDGRPPAGHDLLGAVGVVEASVDDELSHHKPGGLSIFPGMI